jgi:hypothetical protein
MHRKNLLFAGDFRHGVISDFGLLTAEVIRNSQASATFSATA